jgi:signal transduction histidine kinase
LLSNLRASPIEQATGQPDLARALQAIGNPVRLRILEYLIAAPRGRSEAARELGISAPTLRRHLAVLTSSGMVRTYLTADGEKFRVDERAAALLNASLVHLLSASMQNLGRPGRGSDGIELLAMDVPSPPQSCLACSNSKFVTTVLDDLDHVLDEARRYHGRLQHLSAQVLSAHEAERKRIARELHDDTAQALTSILVRLRLLERSTGDETVKQNVEELRELTGGALESVRRMAMDLRPAALDDLGLVAALRAYCEKFSRNWPIRVEVTTSGLKRRLPREVELVLYRVVQEALTNVAKHSGATSAWVSLRRRSNVVTMTVRDDGRGFDPATVGAADGSGLGLFGMRERLALVGGSTEIDSLVGRGTTITTRVLLQDKVHNHM